MEDIDDHGLFACIGHLDVVPNLKHLTLWGYFSHEARYQRLFPWLQRSVLQSFKMILPADPETVAQPSPDIIHDMQVTTMAGKMEIQIGPYHSKYTA